MTHPFALCCCSDSDSDDSDDEEAALLAELGRIKKERAEEAARKEADEEEKLHKERQQELQTGNANKRPRPPRKLHPLNTRLSCCHALLIFSLPAARLHVYMFWRVLA